VTTDVACVLGSVFSVVCQRGEVVERICPSVWKITGRMSFGEWATQILAPHILSHSRQANSGIASRFDNDRFLTNPLSSLFVIPLLDTIHEG
jgi:hypothetical protein